MYGSVDTDQFRAAGSSDERLQALRTYGDSRWPDYQDGDGDGMVDEWDERAPGGPQHTLAGLNVNHPAYREDFQLKAKPGWLGSGALRNAIAGIPLAQNLPFQGHEAPGSAAHTSSDVMVFASGPGSEFFARSLDNTEVFFGLAAALGTPGEPIVRGGGGGGNSGSSCGDETRSQAGLIFALCGLAAYGAIMTAYAVVLRRSLAVDGARSYSDEGNPVSTFGGRVTRAFQAATDWKAPQRLPLRDEHDHGAALDRSSDPPSRQAHRGFELGAFS